MLPMFCFQKKKSLVSFAQKNGNNEVGTVVEVITDLVCGVEFVLTRHAHRSERAAEPVSMTMSVTDRPVSGQRNLQSNS